MPPEITIIPAETSAHIATARELFLEYAGQLGFDLCFQSFDEEVAGLPGKYASPQGCLWLAEGEGEMAGCVAVRPLEAGVCELKRLYVRPQWRGHGIGLSLTRQAIQWAREAGYRRMRLDTIVATMAAAVAMYRQLGFYEIPPYTQNPIPGAAFFELDLAAPPQASSGS